MDHAVRDSNVVNQPDWSLEKEAGALEVERGQWKIYTHNVSYSTLSGEHSGSQLDGGKLVDALASSHGSRRRGASGLC